LDRDEKQGKENAHPNLPLPSKPPPPVTNLGHNKSRMTSCSSSHSPGATERNPQSYISPTTSDACKCWDYHRTTAIRTENTEKEKEDNQSHARSGLHTDLKVRGFIHTLTPNSSKTFIQFRV